jgi:hypothetical protein
MSSRAEWISVLAAAVVATVAAAAAKTVPLHMAVAALACLVMVFMAIREHQTLKTAGASVAAIARSTARYLGLVWAWAALSLAATYLLIIGTEWAEWWQFVIGFAFAAVLSMAFAKLLDGGAVNDAGDDPIIKIGRLLVWVQLVGLVAAIVSLFVDNKFPRDITHADWAGSNIFFFGALAIAVICLDALRSPLRP